MCILSFLEMAYSLILGIFYRFVICLPVSHIWWKSGAIIYSNHGIWFFANAIILIGQQTVHILRFPEITFILFDIVGMFNVIVICYL